MKDLLSYCFVIEGHIPIEDKLEMQKEIQDVVNKYMLKNKITKREQTALSDRVIEMIQEYHKWMEEEDSK